ncbi:MAG: hypothetical protein ACM3O5_12825 [Betaproteobacteria bacterium]
MPAIIAPRLPVNIDDEGRKGKRRRASHVTHVKPVRSRPERDESPRQRGFGKLDRDQVPAGRRSRNVTVRTEP